MNWVEPSGISPVNKAVIVTKTVEPGSTFKIGTRKLVEYTFIDSDGYSSGCDFEIILTGKGC